MAKKKCPDCPVCLPAWLAAFGDLMSLLLCFFVLLLSMATMEPNKVEEAAGSFKGTMSVLDGGTNVEVARRKNVEENPNSSPHDDETADVREVTAAVSELNEMEDAGQGPMAQLEESEKGFVIKLPSKLLFKKGSAKIESEDSLLFLKRIALIIQNLPTGTTISVGGYSDNIPPDKDSPYKNNWELSSARALSVLQELVLDGVRPERLSAAAYGSYHPVATNLTKEGRAKNRRVEIKFYSDDKRSRNEAKEASVLD
ncbi:MAG: OmpA family protein [Helicobacteraceae bacterium]|nr:OmpA family protein [Helicobacteraceae bacterium]